MPDEPKPPLQLRRGRGVLLAVLWNAPFVLFLWYPFHVFHLAAIVNAFIWSVGCEAMRRSAVLRDFLFRPPNEAVRDRCLGSAVILAAIGAINLAAWWLM